MNARRPLTDEQRARADARREQFRALAQSIAAMTDDQRSALAARMAGVATVEGRRLSLHNACLLATQRPDATMVGGFNQWKAHGRVVRKGEHSLMIWAPVRSAGAEQATPGPGELSSARPRFIMVSVFDVSQTEAQA